MKLLQKFRHRVFWNFTSPHCQRKQRKIRKDSVSKTKQSAL